MKEDAQKKKLRLLFAGTPDFAVPALQSLIDKHQVLAVFTQPDRPAGRGQALRASPVKALAEHHYIPVHQPLTLKSAEAADCIANYEADAMIVAAYGLILPSTILNLPKWGCLNIHASLLPRWRGAAPIQRAILAGDSQTGISIMQMDEGLDTGAVLSETSCVITEHDTSASLQEKLATLGAIALLEVLAQVGSLQAKTQNENLATYAAKLTKSEARLDWSYSAKHLDRAIRAYLPWPIAHTSWDDLTLRVWEAQALNLCSDAAPGTIIAADKTGLDVATGEGVLRITKIQWPGKTAITIAEALNAHKDLAPGVRLS